MNTEIIVIGAGPTGLTLASELYRHGVPARIIDSSRDHHKQARATGIKPRTLEIFRDTGVLEDILRAGHKQYGLRFYQKGRKIAEISTEAMDTPYPFYLSVDQWRTERILEARLEQLGGRVERPICLVGLEQDADTVHPLLLDQDGTRSSPAVKWLVGCDGAHSAVRKSVNASFVGKPYEESFFLADVDLHWELGGLDKLTFFTSEHGMCLVVPMPGKRRVRLFLDLEYEGMPTLDVLEEMVNQRICGRTRTTLSKMRWRGSFRVHKRIVSEYRHGRVFLVGDAAHIHSPVGGHGMNLGIQDAHNLAWKLALIVRRKAKSSILESYQIERRPLARDILSISGSFLDLPNNPTFHLLFFDQPSSCDEDYARFARLSREIRDRWGDVIQTHVVVSSAAKPAAPPTWSGSVVLDLSADLHRRYNAVAECVYLIRPDGYIGFRSQPVDRNALVDYFQAVLE